MKDSIQQNNIPKQEQNNKRESLHSQNFTQNNNYYNKLPTPDSNLSKKYYTQRDNTSKVITKLLKNNQKEYYQNINSTFPIQGLNDYYIKNNSFSQNNCDNYNLSNNKNPLLEHQLKQLKLNYITLNNDNIIYREDIYKLMEINKKLEKELSDERNHNYELAKENDKLNNDNQMLFKQIDEINQKITQIKIISQNEKEIMDKQLYFEEKINEKDFECKKILEDNNKLNSEYTLLNDKYIRLKEKNDEEEKELNLLKNIQEEKISEIEKKLVLLMNEMNKLKNENNDLKIQNENYRNNIMKNDKERNDYYNKYQEQKMKNDAINKEIQDIQLKYREYQKKLEKKEEKKIIKENIRKNKSENKIKAIQDLQKRIQEYKSERARKQSED